MCSDDTSEFPTDEPIDESFTNESSELIESNDEATNKPGWSRRKFLKAAALGAAAAALLQKGESGSASLGGLRFGAASALAASYVCKAGDIDVFGGQVINAPCNCNGTFAPQFRFFVNNENNANRTCITLILGTSTDANCSALNGQRLILRQESGPNQGKSYLEGFQNMVPMIGTFDDTSLRIPCDFTECCFTDSVIAFRTAKNQQDTDCARALLDSEFAPAQCRKRNICLTGFGVSVACSNSSCDSGTVLTGGSNAQACTDSSAQTCTVACGGALYLKVTAIGRSADCTDPNAAPTVTLSGPGIDTPLAPTSSKTDTTSNGTPRITACFTVTAPQSGCYTVTATDCHGCTRSATINVQVSTLTKPTLTAGTPTCSGAVTYTVTNCNSALTYTYKEVNCSTGAVISTLDSGVGLCSLTHTWPQDGANHCVTVTVSNTDGSCPVTSDMVTSHINAPVAVSLGAPAVTCAGVVTMTVTLSGGSGTWNSITINGATGTVSGTGNTRTVTISTLSLNTCITVTVTATDSAGCSATSNAQTFKLCASIAAC